MEMEKIEIPFDRILQESDLAWLLDLGDDEVWFPKSQCELDEDNKFIEVPEYIAVDKGLV